MKLWTLEPTRRGKRYVSLDCNDAFVIRAEDEAEARLLAETASSAEREAAVDDGYAGFWLVKSLTKCSELTAEGKLAIILESYRSS